MLTVTLGPTLQELASVAGVIVVLVLVWRDEFEGWGPLAAPVLLLGLGWTTVALGLGGEPLAVVRRCWSLAPAVLAVPLLRAARPLPWSELLLLGAVPASLLGGMQDHHLTWGYIAVPLALVAWGTERRWLAALFALSALSTLAMGVAGALVVGGGCLVAERARGRSAAAMASLAGVAVMLAALKLPLWDRALEERAILWTGGARLWADGGAAVGTWREVVDPHHMALSPTFHFPHHAHDTFIGAAAQAGPAAWVAMALAVCTIWSQGPAWLRAITAALTVGALTQDLLADVEVVRTLGLVASLGLANTFDVPLGAAPSTSRNNERIRVSSESEDAHVDVALGQPGPRR